MEEPHGNEEESVEEIVFHNEHLLHALVDLLVEKKIISEEELNKKMDELEDEEEKEEA